jgi:hypothetical protein
MYGRNQSNFLLNHGFTGQMNYRSPGYYPPNYQPFPRNQPYQYQTVQSMGWYPYQQQNPYLQNYQPFDSAYQSGGNLLQMANTTGQYPSKNAQFLFQNPLQPKEEIPPNQYMPQMNGYSVMNPYPKPNAMIKQPGGIQSLMNSFKSQDGTVDVNKMVNTAGQVVSAVTQVSSLVKGLGGIFKA